VAITMNRYVTFARGDEFFTFKYTFSIY